MHTHLQWSGCGLVGSLRNGRAGWGRSRACPSLLSIGPSERGEKGHCHGNITVSTDRGMCGLSLAADVAGGTGERLGVGRAGGTEAVGREGREGGGPREGGGASDSSYWTGGGSGVCTVGRRRRRRRRGGRERSEYSSTHTYTASYMSVLTDLSLRRHL